MTLGEVFTHFLSKGAGYDSVIKIDLEDRPDIIDMDRKNLGVALKDCKPVCIIAIPNTTEP